MGWAHYEKADRVLPPKIHEQTNSSDDSEEIIPVEWDKMQKGEARESDAISNAPELCSEVQKSGGGH